MTAVSTASTVSTASPAAIKTTRIRASYGRYLEDFNLGDIYEHRPGRTITESDNINFSLLTMNFHPMGWTSCSVLRVRIGCGVRPVRPAGRPACARRRGRGRARPAPRPPRGQRPACGRRSRGTCLTTIRKPSSSTRSTASSRPKSSPTSDPASTFPRHYTGEVIVELADGTVLRHREAVNRGNTDRPLTADDILAKRVR